MSDAVALARWLLVLELASWGLYPFLYLATPGLRDRGLTVAKPFAFLLLAYPAWLLASLGLPAFTTPVLAATLLLLTLAAWGLTLRRAALPLSLPILGGGTAPDMREPARLFDGQAGSCAHITAHATDRSASPRIGGSGGALTFLRAGWRYALATEVLFLAAFLAYAWLRGYNPQILGTEKPMEIGFLTSTMRTVTMPPPDPWLSGYGINYYYLGYVVVAALAKLAGVPATIAFNLALGTLFAATLTGGVGLTANLLARAGWPGGGTPRLRHLLGGLFGGYLLALAGNMYAAGDILARGRAAIDAWWWGGLGWKSSRVVIDTDFPARFFGPNVPPSETINEFPYFSFILGDLHAHVLALPFTVLALALALDAWCVSPLHDRQPSRFLPGAGLARLGVAALAIGSLYALNSWDLPTYAVLYGAALLLRPLLRSWPARREWLAAGLFGAAALGFFLPYYLHFTSLVGGLPFDLPEPWRSLPLVSRLSKILGLVIWRKTPAGQFFTVYLLPYVVGLLFLAWLWRRARGKIEWTVPALTLLALGLAATLLQMPVLFFAGVIVTLALALLRRPRTGDADAFAALLFGAALALVLVTEVFFIHDVFGNRMNTVFKVYYQAWTLLAVASGYALSRALFRPRRWRLEGYWRVPAAAVAALLLLASTAYPLVASWARTDHFTQRQGLDGMAFIRTVAPDEYAGITWVRDHVPGGTVVAEAPGCSYGEWNGLPHDRVSAFAGVTTPLGWEGHEQQWRGGAPALLAQLGPRQDDMTTLYSTTDLATATRLLDRYRIEYVYVGRFERDGYASGGIGADCKTGPPYPAAGLAKFDRLMEPVFHDGRVTIYRRR